MTRIIKADAIGAERPRAGALNLSDIAAEARAIVLEARKEAARIAAEARAAADEMQHAAARKAYDEGFARGQSDGYAQGKRLAGDEAQKVHAADLSGLAALLGKAIDEVAAARREVIDQARNEMLEFALAIAGKVVGHVAAGDISAARTNLEKALHIAHGRGELTVRVNPEQLQQLERDCEAIAQSLGQSAVVRLVGDERIARGGVKVQMNQGEIDATIQTQLDAIVQELKPAG